MVVEGRKYRETMHRMLLWMLGGALCLSMGVTAWVTDNSIPADLLCIQWKWLGVVMCIVLPIWAVGCMVNPRCTGYIGLNVTEWGLMFLGTVQALYGLGQIIGIYPSGHSHFVLTGTFYNPGPYSGYLAAILPVALHKMLSASGQTDCASKVRYHVAWCAVLLIGCVIPAGMSRAAWLAVAVSCAYVAFRMYGIRVKSFILHHKCLVCVVCLLGAVGIIWAYLMKRDSADGRLFIWKVTSQAIAASPMGETSGRTFSALYGDAQEKYFTEGAYTDSEAWVAGTPDFAFNEYLQIAAEYGIWAAVLCVLVLGVLLYVAGTHRHLIGMGGCLVSLMVFAGFSYPLHIPGIVSIGVLAVMVLVGEGLMSIKGRIFPKVILLCMVSVGVMLSLYGHSLHTERLQTVKEWMPARVLYHAGAYRAAVDEYGKLYSRMSWYNDFCFEYGRLLYSVKRYEEAEKVLQKALAVSGDPMILNLLGRNAQDSGRYEKAEEYLLRSTRRLPERMYPHYLLVKLYAVPEFCNKEKLLAEVRAVLHHKPKVHSTAVREMRKEVEEILKERGWSD